MNRQGLMVTTGDPVESVLRYEASFFDMVLKRFSALGEDWQWHHWDPRTGLACPNAPDGGFTAVIISGSPQSAYEAEPWMLALEAQIRHWKQVETSVLGLCFGHQIMAQALGGKVAKNHRGREIGTVNLCWDNSVNYGNDSGNLAHQLNSKDVAWLGSGAVRVQATHSDTVTELPPGSRRLAWTELEEHAVIRFAPGMLGVQFHPEFSAEVMRCYLVERAEAIQAEGLPWSELFENVEETADGGRIFEVFLREELGLLTIDRTEG